MSVEAVLSRLDKVRASAGDRWTARCPAHDDRGPSLALRALPDGRVLLHCFAGCTPSEVLGALGLDFDVLFPERAPLASVEKIRRPFPAADVLRCLGLEAMVVLFAGRDLLSGQHYDLAQHTRLVQAVSRIQSGLSVAEVSAYG